MVKRELIDSDRDSDADFDGTPSPPSRKPGNMLSSSPDNEDDKPKTPKKQKRASTGPSTASPKTRLPAEAKRAIAREIILKGVNGVDMGALQRETGLTGTQIRSQLSSNRQNVRKQLLDLAETLA